MKVIKKFNMPGKWVSWDEIKRVVKDGGSSELVNITTEDGTIIEVKRMGVGAADSYIIQTGYPRVFYPEGSKCPCIPGCYLYPGCAKGGGG